jgi:hypothetical protein
MLENESVLTRSEHLTAARISSVRARETRRFLVTKCLRRQRVAVGERNIVGLGRPRQSWECSNAELDCQRLGLTDVILCEVLQGVRDELAAKDVKRRLLKLEVSETGGVDLARVVCPPKRALSSADD